MYITLFNSYFQFISKRWPTHYSRACTQYSSLLDRNQLLTQKLPQTRLRCSWVEIIATNISRSSSHSCRPLRNIHIHIEGQWIFSFLHKFFLSSVTDKTFTRLDYIYIWVTRLVIIRSRNCLPFVNTSVPPPFLVGFVLLIFLDFCVVFMCFVCLCLVCCVPNVVSVSGLFVFVLRVVCPMLSVFLDCLSLSCVLCAQCCQCFWIVCLCLVCCVPNVVSVSGFSIIDCPLGFL